jgi:very-short-patch-repair endonuclease
MMQGKGYKVLRIAAVEVLKNIDNVMQTIRSAVDVPLHRASTVPSPQAGRN